MFIIHRLFGFWGGFEKNFGANIELFFNFLRN